MSKQLHYGNKEEIEVRLQIINLVNGWFFGLLKIMLVLFGLADTFHVVKRKRERRKEVRYHCPCLLAKTSFFHGSLRKLSFSPSLLNFMI
jgi:hypothetical protein